MEKKRVKKQESKLNPMEKMVVQVMQEDLEETRENLTIQMLDQAFPQARRNSPVLPSHRNKGREA